MCPTEQRALAARARSGTTLARMGLRLHRDKSSIRDIRQGDVGFDFLGFHHHMVPSTRRTGRRYLARW